MKIDLNYSYDNENIELEEFIEKYSADIESGNISDQCIKDALCCVLDVRNDAIETFKYFIEMIYSAIICMKYYRGSDIGLIGRITKSICYLKQDPIFTRSLENSQKGIHDLYDIEGICKLVYEELKQSEYVKCTFYNITIDVGEFEDEEELHIDHLLDLKYHLNNFRKWTNGNNPEFIEVLDKELWRYT